MGAGGTSIVAVVMIIAAILFVLAAVFVAFALVLARREGRADASHDALALQHVQQARSVRLRRDQTLVLMPAPPHRVAAREWQHASMQTPVQAQHPAAPAVILQRPWPGVADALDQHLRAERDPVERMRVTVDLASLGGARSAHLLVDAVRDGVISPTAGAQAVSRTGFEGGVIAGAALTDADPRVQMFARMVVDGSTKS